MEEWSSHKKIFSKLGICYAVGTAVVYVIQILLSVALGHWEPAWIDDINVSLILSSVIVYGIGMPIIVFLAKSVPAQKPERRPMKWWQFLLAVPMCYAVTIISNIVGLIITFVIGLIKGSPVQNSLLDVVTGGNIALNFILMVVIAPIVEEYVFRKVLVDRTLRYGQGVAIVISALMFGLFHGNLNQFAYAVMLGGFFAFLYVKTGNLKITIGIHAIINLLGGVIGPLVLRAVDLDALDSGDISAVMESMAGNIAGWILYMGYAFLIIGLVLAGVIILIVSLCQRRFKLEPGENAIPKGKRFSTVVLNPGMIVFCVAWIILIIIQLFL